MIASILIFSLKSTICSGIFLAYYLLVLKNTPMNGFNRIYLLMAVTLSLTLPFVRLEVLNIKPVAVPDFPMLAVSANGIHEAFSEATGRNVFDWRMLLSAVYFMVAAIMVLGLAAKIIRVHYLKRKGGRIKRDGFFIIKTSDPRAPFSFMNMLFWPLHMREDSAEGKTILMHELAHIKQRHTVDKIFMQLLLAASWLNPFNWLIKKELCLQHEFLADGCAIKDGNTETFARMLLYSVVNSSKNTIISPFFQSPVKRRLMMLRRSARNSNGFLRRFLAVPVLMTAIFLLSADTKKTTGVRRSPKKIVLVLDAAHGGADAGGKSLSGYVEKDFTLALSRKLAALSKEYNIETITTRTEDVYPSLQERVQKSNSNNADVFLSVHVNQSTAVRDNTWQLGVNPKGPYHNETMLLASAIAARLKGQQLPVEIVDHSISYILKENRRPAMLIECGNLDDADNIALLKDETRTETLCRNVLSGIVDYNAKLNAK